MKTEGEKDHGKKSNKLAAGLKKLSPEQLGELHDAIATELKRRAQDKADKKRPSEMSDQEFKTFVAREIGKHEKGYDEDE